MMPPRQASRRMFPSSRQPLLITLTRLFCVLPAMAKIRVVTSQGKHRMGDRDTNEDEVRLATKAAKRNALEQVATHLESITVGGGDITNDEIRIGGMVEVGAGVAVKEERDRAQ